MLSHHSHKRSHLVLSLLLISLFVFNASSQVRRRIEVSRSFNPSPVAGIYFRNAFRFGRGVVPRGRAQFISPTNAKLNARQLELVILDKTKLSNGRPDYDAIGVRWQGQIYQLGAQDDLILPMMKFVQRGSYIAYTLGVAEGFNRPYFRRNGLVPFREVKRYMAMGYVASEFTLAAHGESLETIDFDSETEEFPVESISHKNMILEDVASKELEFADLYADGSYVNADFHVTYQAFLMAKGKRVVDVGGLPLRYAWKVGQDGRAKVYEIEVFTFPEDVPKAKFEVQDRAVMFFQTAAILRQFNQDNKPAFNRFMREVGAAVRKQ